MKNNIKAQFLFGGIILISVASISLAFRARDLTKMVYVHASSDPTTKCTVPFLGITTIPNGRPVIFLATTTSTQPCVLKTWYYTD
jgi:hypothetical protein